MDRSNATILLQLQQSGTYDCDVIDGPEEERGNKKWVDMMWKKWNT